MNYKELNFKCQIEGVFMKTYIDHGYLYYYDTSLRLWTIYPVNEKRNQLADAEYFSCKELLKLSFPELEFIPE